MSITWHPEIWEKCYQERAATESDIWEHLPFFREVASVYEVKIAELGVRTGNSTSAFLAAAAANQGFVLSVDTDEPLVPEEWRWCQFWTFLRCSDLDETLLQDAKEFAPFDVLFIDTSHAYMHTLLELEAWVPMVRPGGIVLMHDTEYEPSMHETGGIPQPSKPVFKAMKEYCAEHDLPWENRTNCFGLGIIRIPGG